MDLELKPSSLKKSLSTTQTNRRNGLEKKFFCRGGNEEGKKKKKEGGGLFRFCAFSSRRVFQLVSDVVVF